MLTVLTLIAAGSFFASLSTLAATRVSQVLAVVLFAIAAIVGVLVLLGSLAVT